jgi:hypothetical protein
MLRKKRGKVEDFKLKDREKSPNRIRQASLAEAIFLAHALSKIILKEI